MSLLASFIASYKSHYVHVVPQFDESLMGLLKKTQYLLLDDKFSPSLGLKVALNKLQIRVEEPMKVAITGQFSSGKSTFLNALLAKKILPTGITPVTSKVNYIRYGDEFRIRVCYLDGRTAYHDIKDIARFTDQRENVEEIDYLTLYAPLEVLKDVIFIDTPGLNSDASQDTQETVKVLMEVDGIIWLTLMDNAGKMSELSVLEEYLGAYQNKSLCILNQKDKFTAEQVEEITRYVKVAFKEFFCDVIPISAKQALESRSHDRKVLMQEKLENFLKSLHVKLSNNTGKIDFNALEVEYKAYQKTIDTILQSDSKANTELLNASNIDKVFSFIKEEIQPKAFEAKDFAIKKEITLIASKLIDQHRFFLTSYDELRAILIGFETEAKINLETYKSNFSSQLKRTFMEIEQIIQSIADCIYHHISMQEKIRYEMQKAGLFGKNEHFVAISYLAPKVNADAIYKTLFYEDASIQKLFKQYEKSLFVIQNSIHTSNQMLYSSLEKSILKWQSRYEFTRKSDDIFSDIEFANMRKFASKVYENVLKSFHDEFMDSYAIIGSKFSYFSGAINFNYQNATEVCVAFLEDKIAKSTKLYEDNPTKFSLYSPKMEEIKERLKITFHLHEFENAMNAKRTFVSKDYDKMIEKFEMLHVEKMSFLEKRQERHHRAIRAIEELVHEVSAH